MKLDFYLTRRLLHYFRPYRKLLFLTIGLMIVAKILEAYVPLAIGKVSDLLLEQAVPFSIVISQSMIILSILILAFILDSVVVIMKNKIGQNALFTLRNDVYEHIQKLPISFFNKNAVGTLMTRCIHDVEQINIMFSESIVPLFGSMVLFVSIFIGIIFIDWRIALTFAFILPMMFAMTNRFRINQRRCFSRLRVVVARMNAFVQEHLMGASTIRSFGLQKEEKKLFEEINKEHRDTNIETIHHYALFFAQLDFVQSFSLIAVFTILTLTVPFGEEFQAGTFFALSLYVLMLFRPLSDLADRYNVLQSAIASGERIFKLLNQPVEKDHPGPELYEIQSITFEDVWFAYEGENWVLKGLTFQMNKGDSLALVGSTGAGKTTVINLLLRFFDYQKGSIKINGREIREYSLEAIRKQFSLVLQDPEIFSGSVESNITLYNPMITKEEVDHVVDYINLKPLINSLSGGLNHILSERGKSLSVGQRQLLSMARAVAHPGSLLVLDEATANIDTATERTIQNALKKILHDKTALVIAHRLSTIKDVKKILVLHHGIVAEQGSHQELLAQKGIYEKLYRLNLL